MDTNAVLFIGCGDGQEMDACAGEQGIRIVGLEPAEAYYTRAAQRFRVCDWITIHKQGLREYSLAVKDTRFDRIYLLFPAPQMLLFHEQEIADSLTKLLKPLYGVFTMCSEITTDWMNLHVQFACARLRDALTENGFSVEASKVSFAELPKHAQLSGFVQGVKGDGSIHYELLHASQHNLNLAHRVHDAPAPC